MFTRKLCIVSTRALIAENALVIVAIEKITPLFVFFSLRFFSKNIVLLLFFSSRNREELKYSFLEKGYTRCLGFQIYTNFCTNIYWELTQPPWLLIQTAKWSSIYSRTQFNTVFFCFLLQNVETGIVRSMALEQFHQIFILFKAALRILPF